MLRYMEKVIIQKLNNQEITERQILKWPVWEKEVSRFSHTYDGDEECLFLEGDVIIETKREIIRSSQAISLFSKTDWNVSGMSENP